MLTFAGFLEEIATTGQKIIVPPEQVDQLARRFGDQVRQMGQWNTSDGSLEVPIASITEAARQIGCEVLARAVHEIKDREQLTGILESSSARLLIGKIAECSRARFRSLMSTLESSNDPAETERLKRELDLAIFGS